MYHEHDVQCAFDTVILYPPEETISSVGVPTQIGNTRGLFFADGMATPTLAGGVFTTPIPHYMIENLVHFVVILAGDAMRGLVLYIFVRRGGMPIATRGMI